MPHCKKRTPLHLMLFWHFLFLAYHCLLHLLFINHSCSIICVKCQVNKSTIVMFICVILCQMSSQQLSCLYAGARTISWTFLQIHCAQWNERPWISTPGKTCGIALQRALSKSRTNFASFLSFVISLMTLRTFR
jgi:hypothetical protein